MSDLESAATLSSPLVELNNSISCPNPRQVLRICLNLKHLIDKVIPVLLTTEEVVSEHSVVISKKVLRLTYEAAGGKGDGKPGTSSYKYRAALIFCLIKVSGWYYQLSLTELSDNELYILRSTAAQQLAKLIIEEQEDHHYLFISMLCHRYSINLHDVDTEPANALELAVDRHSTIIISSSGYQRCIKWLWRGWITQSPKNPHSYVLFKDVASSSLSKHFSPARIQTPLYQNTIEIIFSFIYLALFTVMLNTHTAVGAPLDFAEALFYLFTIGSVWDELVKFYHVGYYYLGFWNAFNDTMYIIIMTSMVMRFISLGSPIDSLVRIQYDEMSYRVLACASPFMWSRLLLYLDAQKFVGAMIVVIKTMMKESIIFFVLLSIIVLGFLQGFLGLDSADGKREASGRIALALFQTIMGDGSFDAFESFSYPYASILYYVYSFAITVILLNILVALYSTAYSAIVDNANDEYLALVAQKTLRYIRAPDEMVYVPPLNLVELAISPLRVFLTRKAFEGLNYYIMLVIYSPALLYICYDEANEAKRIQYNKFKQLPEDANEMDTEWDLTDGYDEDLEGIQERIDDISNSLSVQRAAEREDPEFPVNMNEFDKKIDEATQPIENSKASGIKWELYDLHSKIDKLTELVAQVVGENQQLKAELAKN